jgi:TolB-like protein/DNA-binding winged helix-turn-helix (wHTH) protein
VPYGVIKFAEFELDSGRYELRRGESVLKLEKIPMELLIVLVESNGQLVTRDEIIEKIWGRDVFLDTEHGINTAIRKIRQALGDDPEKPRFVQTVTGKGYRFIAERKKEDERPQIPSLEVGTAKQTQIAPGQTGPAKSGRRWAAPIVPLALCLLGGALLRFNAGGIRDRFLTRNHSAGIQSLAVLPLENLSGDPAQEYFADGMTDELITMLAKNTALRITSRTSVMQYKKVHRPLREIAQELGVDAILEGSVGRSGNRMHLTVQLIRAVSDTHLWAESFNRDLSDLGSLQDQLAKTIAKQVGVRTSELVGRELHINPQAHDFYLWGRYYWFASEYEKSRGYFQKAIDLQPDYAAALSGLADSYSLAAIEETVLPENVMPQAEKAARQALELDDQNAEAHNSMAMIQLFFRWNWAAAERESARAIELNPNLEVAHFVRSYVLRPLNRMEEALQEEKKAMELDPFSEPGALVYVLIRMKRFDDALNEARVRSDAQPNNAELHDLLSYAYFCNGMEKESEEESERYLQLAGEKNQLAEQTQVYRRGGFRAVLEWKVDELKRKAAKQYVSPLDFADVYAQLGRKEETIRYLEDSYRKRAPHLVFLQSHPGFDFLHSDPRYRAIVQQMGLAPAY